MIGLGTFVAGLVVAGAAPSMWLFVAGRAVQGPARASRWSRCTW